MCYCGLSENYENCCGRYVTGNENAPTPESLMRSRFSAFVEKNMDYIGKTHDPQTRQNFQLEANLAWAESVNFTRLEVLNSLESGNKGVVEFVAHYTDKTTGEEHKHHELSKFRKQAGVWYFREGKILND